MVEERSGMFTAEFYLHPTIFLVKIKMWLNVLVAFNHRKSYMFQGGHKKKKLKDDVTN